jgi:hypothetical protein
MARVALAALLLGLLATSGAAGAGKPAGSRVVVLDARGRLAASVPVDGPVFAVAGDRGSGWFVLGAFRRIGGVNRLGLAHLRADGSVDPWWWPGVAASGVNLAGGAALAVSTRRVYVAAAVPGHLVALDRRTGARLRTWRPPSGPWSEVLALANAARDLVVGGEFRGGLMALHARTGVLDRTWVRDASVAVGHFEGGRVAAMTVAGRRVYVAGQFVRMGGLRRNGLAALDARSGAVIRSWHPAIANCRFCATSQIGPVAAAAGHVFVGGGTKAVSGQRFHGIAALDSRTGAPDRRWRGGIARGRAVVLTSVGNRVYAGGDFRMANGFTRRGLAAFAVSTGRLLPSWTAPPHAVVLALAPSGSRLLVAARLFRHG